MEQDFIKTLKQLHFEYKEYLINQNEYQMNNSMEGFIRWILTGNHRE